MGLRLFFGLFFLFLIFSASASDVSRELPKGLKEFTKNGIIVIVYEDNWITVDGKPASIDTYRQDIKTQMQLHNKEPLKAVIHLGADTEIRATILELFDDAPSGSAAVFFAGDMFFGGAKK